MERAPGRPNTISRLSLSWSWRRIAWQVLPVVAIALGAFFLSRGFAGGESTSSPSAKVDGQYAERLAANITFFETRVEETRDSLSYNRLVSLYLERLRLTANASDVARAELAATKSLELAPNAYASVMAMAQVRLAQHDFGAVLALTSRAAALRPDEADTFAISGDAKMALGRYKEAGDDYRKYLELAPGFSAFSREAIYAETNGNIALAEQFWTAAINATRLESPIDSAWARVQLGNLQAANGKLDDAEAEFDMALKVFPRYPLAEAGQARVATMRGDFDEALALYAAVVAKFPSPEFVAPYAEAALAAGETAVAARQAALMTALGALSEANGIRNDLTLILFELDHGDAAAALPKAEAAYRERPSLAAADSYAWALYRAGRFDEAAEFSTEALRLGTKEPLYFFHAGVIAAARGDAAGSDQLLRSALDINPEFHPIHAREAELTLKQLEAAR